MLVLTIIGIVAVLGFLYWMITTLNSKVIEKFDHDFFDLGLFFLAFISNLLIYFGHDWYLDALAQQGDILNGMIIIGIGAVGLLLLIMVNIRQTNLIVGIIGSIIQLFLFAIGSLFGAIGLIVAGAALMGTRPVFVLND